MCAAAGLPVPLEAEQLKRMPSLKGCYPDEIMNVGGLQAPYSDIKAGDIYNTSQVIEDHTSNSDNICLVWLNKQPPNSVLYVSFGTSTSFSDEQIKELAMGLEQSKQKFIWVLRDADEGVIFTGEARTKRLELPEGFEERVKGVGLVPLGLCTLTKKREELVTASTIENVVRKLMASEEGNAIRKRAEELGESVRRSTEKGGVSQKELESLVEHITR
ncbi:hypothetical protein HAX54_043277 [Datura stramonium]|uniref:Uncharacterized protein n=1 Tax=Datura stramonium TaxID=4076 RepID=A0ABS8W2W7_DATST|nr:hypothetical protein [Datura stramonium]